MQLEQIQFTLGTNTFSNWEQFSNWDKYPLQLGQTYFLIGTDLAISGPVSSKTQGHTPEWEDHEKKDVD